MLSDERSELFLLGVAMNDNAKQKIDEAQEKAADAVKKVSENGKEVLDKAKEGAYDLVDKGKEKAEEANNKVKEAL